MSVEKSQMVEQIQLFTDFYGSKLAFTNLTNFDSFYNFSSFTVTDYEF
jgi:hypothetical protein